MVLEFTVWCNQDVCSELVVVVVVIVIVIVIVVKLVEINCRVEGVLANKRTPVLGIGESG